MSYIKARTLLNHCFALDEFVPGLCTSLVGTALPERELRLNHNPHAGFLRDAHLVSLFNEALKGHKQPLETLHDDLMTEPAYHRNPLTISVIYYLYSASVLIPWFFNKGIYLASPTQLQTIWQGNTDEAAVLQACTQLPQWSIFVSLPFFADLSKEEQASYPATLRDIGGFYAALMENDKHEPELGIVMVETSGIPLERIKLNLSAGSFKDSASAYLAETQAHYATFVKEQPQNFDAAKFKALEDSVTTLTPLICNLCAALAQGKFTDLKGQAVLPENVVCGQKAAARLKEQFFCLV